MVIETKAEISFLRFFCRKPFDSYTVREISRQINLSRYWVYKITDKFRASGLVGGTKNIKLNFSNFLVKKIKLMFDSEFVLELKEKKIIELFNTLSLKLSYLSIILVGSWAIKEAGTNSDIDFLLLTERKQELPFFENCNIIQLTREDFTERYRKGDDFVLDALLYGKILDDKNFFINFFEKPLPVYSQEIIEEKREALKKLKDRVYELMKLGDLKTAKEEVGKFLVQKERLGSLEKREIPKTKKEIINRRKIKKLGREEIFKILRSG